MKIIKNKKILIIGGAGFIGSHLCDHLRNHNHVVSLDNYLSGSKSNHYDQVTYLKGTSQNLVNIVGNFSPDYIFHLGEYSRVESSFRDYNLVIENNLLPFSSILNFAKENNSKLIYAGSSTKFASYESDDLQSPYAWIKAKNTEHLKNFARWFSLDYAIVYFYNVYGGNEISEGPFSTVVAKFKEIYLSGKRVLPVVSPGTQKRNFTYYADVIDGLITVAIHGKGDGYGIGSDFSISILELVKLFKCSPKFIESRRGNRNSAKLVTAATHKLGWSSKVSIKEHISNFIKNSQK